MCKIFNNRLTRSAATAALALGLGLGVAAKSFAETHAASNGVVASEAQPTGTIGVAELENMLRAADDRVNVITISGETQFQYYIPAHNGHPDRHIVIGISPNHRYVNMFCAFGQISDRSGPTRQQAQLRRYAVLFWR